MTSPVPARRRRRWPKILLAALALVVALVAAFPWYLGTASARRWMLARANESMAPGKLSVGSFRVSWFEPTRMTDFTLIDPQGDRVVVAPVATWERNLFEILFQRPRLGALTLQHASLDVERRDDGSIDIAEALGGILSNPKPATSFTIHVVDGTFRLRAPILAEPVVAERFDLTVRRPASPGAITWIANLARPNGARILVTGHYDRWGKAASDGTLDLVANLEAANWPMAIASQGLSIRSSLGVTFDARRTAGDWNLAVNGQLLDADIAGPFLRGDRLREPSIIVRGELLSSKSAWNLGNLELLASVGSIRSKGAIPPRPGDSGTIEGNLDLAAIARQLPHTLRLREGMTVEKGSARFTVGSSDNAGNRAWDVDARVSDLIARDGPRTFTLTDPASLSARVVGAPGGFALDRFRLKTPFLDASGSGDLDRGISVNGTVDLAGFQRQFRDLIDFRDLDFVGNGPLTIGYKRSVKGYSGHVDLDLRDVRIAGLGPAPIGRERVRFLADVDGPSSSSGWPQSVASARVEATGGDAFAKLALTPIGGDATDLTISARVPLASEPPGRFEADVSGRLDSSAFELRDARIGIQAEGRDQPSPLAFSARGRYDRVKGDLSLRPVGQPSSAIAIDPKGISAHGLGRKGWSVEGGLVGNLNDLAIAWSSWRGGPAIDVRGGWSAQLSAKDGPDGPAIDGRLATSNISFPDGESRRVEKPISVAIRGNYRQDLDRIELAALDAITPYASLNASGRLDDPMGRRVADLKGTLTPDWPAINALLARSIEPEAHLEGSIRPFWLRGPIGDPAMEFEAGFDLAGADVYGMNLGPAPIVARQKGGKIAIDPIETTLNGGRLHLEPGIADLGERGTAIVLGPGSTIEGAEVNDEVSRRVLSFVAPVLEKATRARGRISVAIRKAEFPLVREAGQRAVVEGDVAFRDVEFVPGPLADDLFGLVGRRPATIRLTKPILLSIADGRVNTRGLAVPIGDVTEIAIEGSVDFDRNLDLVASVPLTSAMVAGRPVLGDILSGTRVKVPIKGTLSAPRIDRDAFKLGMRDMGKDLLERGAARGAMGLLDLITRPRDPNAPPPAPRTTPEERRAKRQERRMERRGVIP